jgi:serine/threonine protein kinase/Flp pilus assembly protein TadD
MTLAASTRLGPYEILSSLGSGGMGEVYRARDTRLERDVAIKVLPDRMARDPVALARFHREARAVAALSHPNIVALYDIGAEQGTHFVVMELLEGQTLGQLLKRAALDWRAALPIAVAVADGLAAAHAKGIIHRDVKPENVYLTTGGGVKVLDFGLVRMEKTSSSATAPGLTATVTLETQQGVLLGTVSYMSPEQVRGQQADARSDVFALGCVLYEMVTGQRPFPGETSADVMAAILQNPPPLLSQSGRQRPAALDAVIARCLEKAPAKRYASAAELAAALRAAAEEASLHDSKHRHGETVSDQEPTGVVPRPEPGPSIAVLPFVNMSSDPENEYFSDGLAEELINVLSKIEGLRVASRTSSFAFKGKNEDVRKLGEQLNVRTVLQGSVRKSGNRIRVSAQLGNVVDGYQLWSETYNRQLEDVFAIQDEIAQSIAKALRVLLTEKDRRVLERAAPTSDVRAYEYYLRGMQLFHQFRRKALEAAVQMFAQAIDIDPGYARAYAGLADCYSHLYTFWKVRGDTLQLAEAASRRALELAPELAEAHTARGLALSICKRFDEARAEFETAIRLNPTQFEARYFYGRACLAQGRLADAAQLLAEASQLRPEDYQALLLGAGVLAGLGRTAEAESAYRRGLRVAENHLTLYPDDSRALCLGATAWCQLGERQRALEWAGRALTLDPDEAMTLYNVACVYSLLGQTEEAVDTLTRAVEKGFTHKEWIQNDADFKPLHGHPRFQALLDSM